ncbi:MAG: hypothetical protein WAN86_13695, partial [Hyphomicrobiaceae bacterium]
MKDSGNPSDDENRSIPAGYTYLGQLVAHDLIHNVLPFSGTALRGRRPVQDDMDLVRDYRTNRLVLDTIYGGGPSTDPLVYGVEASPTRRSFKLRLGEVRVK